jgi:hypothetical protein
LFSRRPPEEGGGECTRLPLSGELGPAESTLPKLSRLSQRPSASFPNASEGALWAGPLARPKAPAWPKSSAQPGALAAAAAPSRRAAAAHQGQRLKLIGNRGAVGDGVACVEFCAHARTVTLLPVGGAATMAGSLRRASCRPSVKHCGVFECVRKCLQEFAPVCVCVRARVLPLLLSDPRPLRSHSSLCLASSVPKPTLLLPRVLEPPLHPHPSPMISTHPPIQLSPKRTSTHLPLPARLHSAGHEAASVARHVHRHRGARHQALPADSHSHLQPHDLRKAALYCSLFSIQVTLLS